jgi:hypothetical protein
VIKLQLQMTAEQQIGNRQQAYRDPDEPSAALHANLPRMLPGNQLKNLESPPTRGGNVHR